MTTDQTILLFPGQGAYAPGCIDEAAVIDPQTYEAVRAVGVELLSVDVEELRHDPRPLSALVQDASKAIQLSIFLAAVVAGNRALGASSPQSLIGHSFGEIAALTVGGAFTPADGARIVAHRVLALDAHAPRDGAMAVFKAVRGQVAALLDAVGSDSLVIAGTNSTDQIVVSGPVNLLSKAESLAAVLDIATARIASPYAFHNPQLGGARAAFQDAVAAVPQLRLMRSVYSPILGRTYRRDDNLAALLAEHLTVPFNFDSALSTAAGDAATTFVECGAGSILSSLVKRQGHEKGWKVTSIEELEGTRTDVREGSEEAWIARLLGHESTATGVVEFWNSQRPAFISRLLTSFEEFHGPSNDRSSQEERVSVAHVELPEGEVRATLARLYADALEYPVEVFLDEPGVQLEADLGVDSVKQTDLLARAAAAFGLAVPEGGIAVGQYPTFGSVVDLIEHGAIPTKAAL
ncbi:ACP S-malonyltransferase [Microbacterium oxydans]|uniref:ACP S-malonyltransferase n=1 Tax=Microbacterium oxydans TaxID=82380 RepID=UPI001E2B7585|nr:acyltransferase domain-containing protein [Microbacterium oxydans]